jgi:FtsZ-binding cell division protein ZapB
MKDFKVCDSGYVLFEDKLLQCVFAESLLAKKAILNFMMEGGNVFSSRSLRKEAYTILCRLPLSHEVMEAIEDRRQYLLDRVNSLEMEIQENDELVAEFKEMIKDAEQRYDEVILNENQQAQYALDVQVKEWADNITSLNKRVKPFSGVIERIGKMIVVVEGMAGNIKARLIKRDVDEAELVFLDQLNDFSKHFIAFLKLSEKAENYPKYGGSHVLSRVYGVLDRSHKEMHWVKK